MLNMPDKLERYIDLLQLLQKATPSQRKHIIEMANGDFIRLLCECCLNVLRGNVPLSPARKRNLKKFAPIIRQVASRKDKNKSLKRKRELLVQQGGFLPALLAPIVSLAGGLIGELVGRHL